MSHGTFVMRRDTRKHVPPRPGAHPHPVPPPRPPSPRRDHDEGGGAGFWKEEERRHARPPATETPDDPRPGG